MLRRSLLLAGVAVATAAVAPAVSAQVSCSASPGSSCSLTHTLSGDVPTLATLTMSSATTAFGSPSAADFTSPTGQLVIGPTLRVDSNISYSLAIAASSANFTTNNGVTKAASTVSYELIPGAGSCAAGTFDQLTTSPVTIVNSASAGDNSLRRLCFQISWNLATDAPGNYSLPMEVTLSAP